MADTEFPSGPWTGYYLYPNGKRGEMDLALQFVAGRMSGTGHDELGHFRIEGHFDSTSHEANWDKTYPDGHTVCYRGFRENPVKGIWGPGTFQTIGREAFTFGREIQIEIPSRT